jgi:hypothetical protein
VQWFFAEFHFNSTYPGSTNMPTAEHIALKVTVMQYKKNYRGFKVSIVVNIKSTEAVLFGRYMMSKTSLKVCHRKGKSKISLR